MIDSHYEPAVVLDHGLIVKTVYNAIRKKQPQLIEELSDTVMKRTKQRVTLLSSTPHITAVLKELETKHPEILRKCFWSIQGYIKELWGIDHHRLFPILFNGEVEVSDTAERRNITIDTWINTVDTARKQLKVPAIDSWWRTKRSTDKRPFLYRVYDRTNETSCYSEHPIMISFVNPANGMKFSRPITDFGTALLPYRGPIKFSKAN